MSVSALAAAENTIERLKAELAEARAENARLRGDQPLPEPGEGDIWQELIDELPEGSPLRPLFVARRELGLKRYGRVLQRGNKRDGERDLQEELLDALAYSRATGSLLVEKWVTIALLEHMRMETLTALQDSVLVAAP